MKIAHFMAGLALGAVVLAGCQPSGPTSEQPEAVVVEESGSTPDATDAADTALALPCGLLAQRDWTAMLNQGSPPTLTVSGEIDLDTPGYSVSLARNDAEPDGATATTLSVRLSPPSTVSEPLATPHAVRYFGPAKGPYETVELVCEGQHLTTITVQR